MLAQIQKRVIGDPADPWRGFYGEGGTPFGEERCRDHLLTMLGPRPEGIDLAPEGHMANDKRADISATLSGMRVPVEIKGQWHKDLWHAADTQLDRLYASDYPDRIGAACAAHARRNFEELAHDGTSPVGLDAMRRFARIYEVEAELKGLSDVERRTQRQRLAKPLWNEFHQWLDLERRLVADGGAAAKAIDYTVGHWTALTRHLEDGAVALDNNHLKRQIKPWAMGRKAWQFVGSELAGQRAAVVMSLVQSARMNGHDPWAYLRNVLQRLPTQLNTQLQDLLPHRWSRS